MISAAIIGGSGYTGKLLIEYLSKHEQVQETTIYGHSQAGKSLYSIFPDLEKRVKNSIIISDEKLSLNHDLYFLALPSGESPKYVPAIIDSGKKAIDLGGDFRLDDGKTCSKFYGNNGQTAQLLSGKAYGLADYNSDGYGSSDLIACPGCYPTASLLSLSPLISCFSEQILSVCTIAYSGTSGAGKKPTQEMLFSEMEGNVRAYNLNKHRHEPEILQELKKLGLNSPYSFSAHLIPTAVGIYATTVVYLKTEIPESLIQSCYEEAYGKKYFIRLRKEPPNLNWVKGTNFCDLSFSVKGKTLIISAAIDNLVKGASGQAVQNMNKLFGWDEKLGLLN